MRLSVQQSGERLVLGVAEGTLSHKYDMPFDHAEVMDLARELVVSLARGTRARKIGGQVTRELRYIGEALWRQLVPGPVRDHLLRTPGGTLLLDLDEALAACPWELLFDGQEFLSRKFALGRTVTTRQPRRKLVSRRHAGAPSVLIVSSDPGDLPEIAEETRAIVAAMKAPVARTRHLPQAEADQVTRFLKDYDLVHFAGHAEYNAADPEESGWVLADGRLRAKDVIAIGDGRPMPLLVFSNGCRSAPSEAWNLPPDRIYGLANAFLLAGVRYYIGTQWDVVDRSGARFAAELYGALAEGRTLGEAVRLARCRVAEGTGEEDASWANYVLYGDPDARIVGAGDTANRRVRASSSTTGIGSAPRSRAGTSPPLASSRARRTKRAIALLPVRAGAAPSEAYLAAAIGEELAESFAASSDVDVIPRGASARAILRAAGSLPAAARTLHVDGFVDPEILPGKGGAELVVRLVDGATGVELCAIRRAAAVDPDLAKAIVEALLAELRQRPQDLLDEVLVDRFLRARARLRTYSAPELAIVCADLEGILAAAPDFAPGLAALSHARLRLWMTASEDDSRQRSLTAARRALALDPELDEARLVAAWLSLETDGDPIEPTLALADVARRCPTNALAQLQLAFLCVELGELDRARRAIDRAELAEPAAATSQAWVRAILDAAVGKPARALKALERRIDAGAKNPAQIMFALRFALWTRDEKAITRLITAAPDDEPLVQIVRSLARAALARALSTGDWERAAAKVDAIPTRRVRLLMRSICAELAGLAGEDEVALAHVERAVVDGHINVQWLEQCPLLERLREQQRLEIPLQRTRAAAERLRRALGYA